MQEGNGGGEVTLVVGRKRTTTTVTVVVKNLPTGTTHDHLHALCHNLKGVVEVEIPARTAIYHKYIFGFVRFVSLEAAMDGVDKLSGLMVQGRRLSAELGRSHWRNTNDRTVLSVDEMGEGSGEMAMSEEEVNTAVMLLCQRQWYQHRRRHTHKGLPPFNQIMDMLCNDVLASSEDEATGCEVDWAPLPDIDLNPDPLL
ncbi:hypothetical protein Pcinc_032168 [Petrolisthes cinctipes]|uniref:RRM domain-containing protein n=1 Tax=Petrolisthes cinctipes TaxID=88211 RepID=A0AAE1K1F4_PETCI|nr:hypothetical protein Pcinc_032168 [Petrolisthes cinctipes]